MAANGFFGFAPGGPQFGHPGGQQFQANNFGAPFNGGQRQFGAFPSNGTPPMGMGPQANGGWSSDFRQKNGATRGSRGGRGRGMRGGGRGGGFNATGPPKAPTESLYCEICRISCAGASTYEEHLNGTKHKKKELALQAGPTAAIPKGGSALRCELCDVACTGSDAYAAHIRGSKHQRVVKLHQKLGKPIPPHEPTVISNKAEETVKRARHAKGKPDAKADESEKVNVSVVETPSGEKIEIPKLPEEMDADPVGNEYIEEMLGAGGKVIGYKCNLCDCQFNDVNAKEMHIKGRRHRTQFKKKVDPTLQIPPKGTGRRNDSFGYTPGPNMPFNEWNVGPMGPGPIGPPGFFPPANFEFSRPVMTVNDRICVSKANELTPSSDEISSILKPVGQIEQALKVVSDAIDAEEKENKETYVEGRRSIKALMRVGDLSNGLIMKGGNEVELVLICGVVPTQTLMDNTLEKIKKPLDDLTGADTNYEVSARDGSNPDFIVTCPSVKVRVTLTSPLVRTAAEASDKAAETGSEGGVAASAAPTDPHDVLDREKCLEALARLRHSKWFQARLAPVQQAEPAIRILRDFVEREPAWKPFTPWLIELLVHEAIASGRMPMQPGDVFKRVLEILASGRLLPDGKGLPDPCEKENVNAAGFLSLQQSADVTECAQKYLRMYSFRLAYKVLNMEPTPRRRQAVPKRDLPEDGVEAESAEKKIKLEDEVKEEGKEEVMEADQM